MRYIVTIGVRDEDIPFVSESVELIEACFSDLGYKRVLPELAALTASGQGNQVTPDKLKRILSNWARDLEPEDFVSLYFAGHGAAKERHFLGLSNTDWNYPSTEALATEDLLRVLTEGTKLKSLLLILDTCYSGQAAFDANRIASELVSRALERSLWLITASLPKQQAGDGAFARTFDELIRKGRGAIVPQFDIGNLVDDLQPHLPDFQKASWTLIGASSTGFPAFLPNPNFISAALEGKPLEERPFYQTDIAQHWRPRAMGSEAIFQAGNWYFTGRAEILRWIVSWLEADTSRGTAYAVTGDPGSGKSAVLGFIVTASDYDELKDPKLQEFLRIQPVCPQPGSVSFAIHLKGKTKRDVIATLVSHFGTDEDKLNAYLVSRKEKTVLVFDALDESSEPSQIGDLLRALTGYDHLWIIVGTRRPELRLLGERVESFDLDRAGLKDSDVALYVETLLLAEQENRMTPYRSHFDTAKKVSVAVASAARGNFLVARIVARSLIERPTRIDLEHERLPQDTREAFSQYLKELAQRNGIGEASLHRALVPLAYAQGQGLTLEAWACVVGSPVREIYILANAFLAEYTEEGRSVYRFFHDALGEALRDCDPHLSALCHHEIAQKLLASIPAGNWLRAEWYTRKYFALHAAHGNPSLLENLTLDMSFLIAADTQRLLSVAGIVLGQEARRRLNWLGLASDRMRGRESAEALSYLEFVALQAGASDLAEAVRIFRAASFLNGKWKVEWASWSPTMPHSILEIDKDRVFAVALADGIVVSGSSDGTIRRLDLKNGELIGEPLCSPKGCVSAVAVADGIVVSASEDGTVWRWGLKSGEPIGEPLRAHEGWVTAVAAADGIIVSGGRDATVRRWDLRSGEPIGEPLCGHEGWVNAVAVADGIVVSVSEDGTVRRWDLRSGEPIGEPLCAHEGWVTAVAAADGIIVSGGGDATVRRWDLKSGEPIGEPLCGHEGWVNAVAVADGIVVSASWDGTVRRWDLRSGEPLGEPLSGHEGGVTRVAVADGVVISRGDDGTVRHWDLNTNKSLGTPLRDYQRDVEAVAVADDIVVSGSFDRTVRRWNFRTGDPIGKPLCGHLRDVLAVAVAENTIVSGGLDDSVRRWNLRTGEPIGEPLCGHEGWVKAVAVADGIVVSGSHDRTLRRWSLRSGKQIGEPLRGHELQVLALAVASGIVVSGSRDATIRRWDLRTGETIGEPLCGHERWVNAVAAANGIVVSGGLDRTVCRWNLKTGEPLGKPLRGHEDRVTTVAIAEGIIVSASADETVRCWNLTTGELLNVIKVRPFVRSIASIKNFVLIACDNGLARLDLSS